MRGDQEYKLSWTDRERLDAHILASASLVGRFWLWRNALFDWAKTQSKEKLPRDVQERIVKLISARGQKHEPAKPNDVSD